jgi:hypothetical protein
MQMEGKRRGLKGRRRSLAVSQSHPRRKRRRERRRMVIERREIKTGLKLLTLIKRHSLA